MPMLLDDDIRNWDVLLDGQVTNKRLTGDFCSVYYICLRISFLVLAYKYCSPKSTIYRTAAVADGNG